MVMMLPVQVDHLKRSGIGKVVMGLLNCKEVSFATRRTAAASRARTTFSRGDFDDA